MLTHVKNEEITGLIQYLHIRISTHYLVSLNCCFVYTHILLPVDGVVAIVRVVNQQPPKIHFPCICFVIQRALLILPSCEHILLFYFHLADKSQLEKLSTKCYAVATSILFLSIYLNNKFSIFSCIKRAYICVPEPRRIVLQQISRVKYVYNALKSTAMIHRGGRNSLLRSENVISSRTYKRDVLAAFYIPWIVFLFIASTYKYKYKYRYIKQNYSLCNHFILKLNLL